MAAAGATPLEPAPHGERTVWMYWEQAPGTDEMPELIVRCVESARRHAVVTLLDRESIGRYVRPSAAADRLPSIAQRADYYRALLLHTHGGMWLDTDTIVLRPLDALFETLHAAEGATLMAPYERPRKERRARTGDVVAGIAVPYLAARAGSAAVGAWVAECERLIASPSCGVLSYEALGAHALTAAINTPCAADCIHPPGSTFAAELVAFSWDHVWATGWQRFEGYYGREREFVAAALAEAQGKSIVNLYGKFMAGREVPRGTLLARLLELSGEAQPTE